MKLWNIPKTIALSVGVFTVMARASYEILA